jgi:hypothetical protein
MSHRWEHEDEYIQLRLDMNRAQREGDTVLYEQLRPRIEELDRMIWRSMTDGFPELASYQTVVEALRHMAASLNLPFPDLANPNNNTGDGKFIFGVSNGQRTVQVWPMEDRGYYNVEVFDYEHSEDGVCYKGRTTSLEAATIVLSRWFVERCSIESLHAQSPWIAQEPLRLSGPRMTFE